MVVILYGSSINWTGILMKKISPLFILVLLPMWSAAQSDSTVQQHTRELREHNRLLKTLFDSIHNIRVHIGKIDEDLSLTGTRIVSRDEHENDAPQITIGGYVCTYFALYNDTADGNRFQKFPTAGPQSNAFALNLAQLSAKYTSKNARAALTMHYGDMPRSVWSPIYNYVQEANVGLRLYKKLWLDAGLFRTHIGLESIQPRENIASGVAVATFFEPYYMSGAKLTYVATDKLTMQLNAFNSFNGFLENNNQKAVGFSTMYEPNSKFSLTFNTLWNDDTPDGVQPKQGRLYNNLYMVYKSSRWTLGAELNYGLQQHTSISSKDKTAQMYSGLFLVKYKVTSTYSLYGRVEHFSDPDEILTGPEFNQNKKLIGLNISGGTVGMEYKYKPNSYLRMESRYLLTHGTDEKIFYRKQESSNNRAELLITFGIWF